MKKYSNKDVEALLRRVLAMGHGHHDHRVADLVREAACMLPDEDGWYHRKASDWHPKKGSVTWINTMDYSNTANAQTLQWDNDTPVIKWKFSEEQ